MWDVTVSLCWSGNPYTASFPGSLPEMIIVANHCYSIALVNLKLVHHQPVDHETFGPQLFDAPCAAYSPFVNHHLLAMYFSTIYHGSSLCEHFFNRQQIINHISTVYIYIVISNHH